MELVVYLCQEFNQMNIKMEDIVSRNIEGTLISIYELERQKICFRKFEQKESYSMVCTALHGEGHVHSSDKSSHTASVRKKNHKKLTSIETCLTVLILEPKNEPSKFLNISNI